MAKKKKAAKGSGVNKSQAIRDGLEKSPNASPKELSAQLTAKGINVSPGYVSIIKYGMKEKRPTRAARSTKRGDTIAADDLLQTKKLIDRVGGIERVQLLLGTLKKLL